MGYSSTDAQLLSVGPYVSPYPLALPNTVVDLCKGGGMPFLDWNRLHIRSL